MRFTKPYSLILIAAYAVPFFSVVGYNFYHDPYHWYHTGFEEHPVFPRYNRYHSAGFIRCFPTDCLIVGNSHTENFVASEVASLFGRRRGLSVTLGGIALSEQSIILKYAFAKNGNDPSMVISGISPISLPMNVDSTHPIHPLDERLYDRNPLNDLSLFTRLDFSKELSRLNKSREFYTSLDPDYAHYPELMLDLHNPWYPDWADTFDRPAFVASNIRKESAKPSLPLLRVNKTTDQIAAKTLANLTHNIVPFLKQHPNTDFYFVLTPHPTYFYQANALVDPCCCPRLCEACRVFVELLEPFPNTHLFGFDNESFVENLRLYKDITHYHIEVNRYMLSAIVEGRNELTTANIDDYLKRWMRRIDEYHLPEEWDPDQFGEEGPPEKGFLSFRDAAKMIYGPDFSEDDFDAFPRSPFIPERKPNKTL